VSRVFLSGCELGDYLVNILLTLDNSRISAFDMAASHCDMAAPVVEFNLWQIVTDEWLIVNWCDELPAFW
jgi:hypothetical protein